MYSSCMNKDELNRIGAKGLLRSIRGNGIWPMLDGDEKWRREDYDLTSLLIQAYKVRGVDVFIANSVSLDKRNVSRRLIQFDQGDLALGESTRDFYLDRERHGAKIEAYRKFLIEKVTQFLQDADLPINRTKVASDVDELIDLETKWAKIIVPEEDRRDFSKMYNLRRLSDMQKLMPLVDWARFLHSVAPHVVHGYLSSNPEILVVEIDYMRRIAELLHLTDPRIITNYVYMRYTFNWEGELGERHEDISQALQRAIYGRKQKASRWKDCTTKTVNRMKYAAGAMYVKEAFDQASKAVAQEMIADLREAFQNMILTNDWMDAKTKASALDKAKQMLQHIAYPDFILDNEKLDDYYSGFAVQASDSYSQMVEKLSRWDLEYEFKRLIKPVDRNEFNFNSALVNAYYEYTSNTINLPAAILQPPFFHNTFPRALNYGGIGAVIGHEVTHGFDDLGRQFDSFGNLREWWDTSTKKKFQERAQCIISQYGNIEVYSTALRLNGRLTQGENIADNGGVKQAFKAYKNYLKMHGEEGRIKGLEQFNNEQMFFLGYALISCGHMTSGHLIYNILTNTHSPARYRVNQVLANLPEFAAAFQCKVGTPMNPTERCAVW
ncbi:hypothetical protein Y032_0017g3170 [Ancylostoma ceylanicum]|nr:hypothetical protein Y032_0017g3170 [Ancylostoma ceylanicum]